MTTKGLERLNRLCAVIGLLALCATLSLSASTPFLPRLALGGVFALAVIASALLVNKIAERARRRDEEVRQYMMKRRGA